MGRYALIVTETGAVDNVIVYDGVSPFTPPDGMELREADDSAEPGGSWNGSEFVRAPTVEPTRLEVLMQEGPAEQVPGSGDEMVDRPPEDIAADKAELLALLYEKLTASQYSTLTSEEMNRMLKLERE